MEGGSAGEVSNSGGGVPASPRWNPTKEQISMLENCYKQGIRTPTADQIQQITARLQAYGHIEGKNVFYWFQNHKARQRQKQKQESLAFFNRSFHKAASPAFPPPPSTNVVCSNPYYLQPQSELGFYPQYPKMLSISGIKRRPRPGSLEIMKTYSGAGYESAHLGYNNTAHESVYNTNDSNCKQETLSLFPLEPTGILRTRSSSPPDSSSSAVISSTTPSCSSGVNGGFGDGDDHQPYFDFFSGNSYCESDD